MRCAQECGAITAACAPPTAPPAAVRSAAGGPAWVSCAAHRLLLRPHLLPRMAATASQPTAATWLWSLTSLLNWRRAATGQAGVSTAPPPAAPDALDIDLFSPAAATTHPAPEPAPAPAAPAPASPWHSKLRVLNLLPQAAAAQRPAPVALAPAPALPWHAKLQLPPMLPRQTAEALPPLLAAGTAALLVAALASGMLGYALGARDAQRAAPSCGDVAALIATAEQRRPVPGAGTAAGAPAAAAAEVARRAGLHEIWRSAW